MNKKQLALSRLTLLMLAGSANSTTPTSPPQQWVQNKEYKLTILHTNDNHNDFWHNKYDEQSMAARATLVNQIHTDVQAQVLLYCYYQTVILIQMFLSQTY